MKRIRIILIIALFIILKITIASSNDDSTLLFDRAKMIAYEIYGLHSGCFTINMKGNDTISVEIYQNLRVKEIFDSISEDFSFFQVTPCMGSRDYIQQVLLAFNIHSSKFVSLCSVEELVKLTSGYNRSYRRYLSPLDQALFYYMFKLYNNKYRLIYNDSSMRILQSSEYFKKINAWGQYMKKDLPNRYQKIIVNKRKVSYYVNVGHDHIFIKYTFKFTKFGYLYKIKEKYYNKEDYIF